MIMGNNRERYIGVMSGTSLDAVDVVLCEIDAMGCRLKASLEYPFRAALKEAVLEMIDGPVSLERVGMVDHQLGVLFADAINAMLFQENIAADSVTAIGLHGQTLWHAPEGANPFSMQLGDPNIVSTVTGISVVADFRRKDIALGGQGAPFAPAFHAFLFGRQNIPTVVVNIGGMANITNLGEIVVGYDTGPGNVLMDLWYARHHQGSFDYDGEWARSGTVDEEWLGVMLEDGYFRQEPPKSTGREHFNESWMHAHAPVLSLMRPEDVQATLCELTVRSICDEVAKFSPRRLLVCGGGARNGYLMERLAATLPACDVSPTDALEVSSEYLEAMAFAWLAYKRLHNESVALSSVTGARSNAVLGGVYA
jgi:anhydro-N-acetylmuramic acid kinase